MMAKMNELLGRDLGYVFKVNRESIAGSIMDECLPDMKVGLASIV